MEAMPRLSDPEIETALEGLPGWAREGDAIVKTFELPSFLEAIDFVNSVAQRAESADHHPDLDIRYRKVCVALSTHSRGWHHVEGRRPRDHDRSPRSRSMLTAIIGAAILALCLAVVVAVARDRGPSPEGVAIAYELAWDRLDFASLWTLSGAELRDGRTREEFVRAKRAAYDQRIGFAGLAARVAVDDSASAGSSAAVLTRHRAARRGSGAQPRAARVPFVALGSRGLRPRPASRRGQYLDCVTPRDQAGRGRRTAAHGWREPAARHRQVAVAIPGRDTRRPCRARKLGQVCTPVLELGPGVSRLACVREEPPGSGPLAALAAGAAALHERGFHGAALLLAVDLPLVPLALLDRLVRWPGGETVVPVVMGVQQTTCARYGADALERVAGLVATGERSLRALLTIGPYEVLTPNGDDSELAGWFRDVDTPEDADALGLEWPPER